MTYEWFKIFNLDEFAALGLVSKTYTWVLTGVGEKDILVTKGINTGITYEGVFLSLGHVVDHIFKFDSHAIYQDVNNDIYLGIGSES